MPTQAAAPRTKKSASQDVVQELSDLCASLRPGDRVPTHTELMRRLHASERMVLRALDEMQRVGKIVRRNGVGTFIAEPSDSADLAPRTSPILPASVSDSRTIVAVSTPDNSFFDRCLDLLFRHTEAADLSLLCRLIAPGAEVTLPGPQAHPSLGFILLQYSLAPLAEKLQEGGNRVVVVGAPPSGVTPLVPCVYSDHEQGGYLAARHLLDLGHRHLAFANFRENTLRRDGCLRAIRASERAGKPVRLTFFSEETLAAWQENPALATQALKGENTPTALLAWNDHEAARLSVTLSRAGVSVPGDVSLMGYDALPEGDLVYPPLTTFDQAIDSQLRAALEILTRPTPAPPGQTTIVLPTLISRESCAAPHFSRVVQSVTRT